MPRESVEHRRRRCAEILSRLDAAYPGAHCELNFSNPLELLVATILSAQCTDKQVNLVTAELFKKYHNAHDYSVASLEELSADVRRIGLYRNKAKNIQSTGRMLLELHHGEVPKTMEELVALPGVGRKTANVVLGNAFGLNVGVVVDTHVGRLSLRLGLTREMDPVAVEQDLMKLVPREQWAMVSHWLIWHGRRRCTARNPDCDNCEIRSLCPTAGLHWTKRPA